MDWSPLAREMSLLSVILPPEEMKFLVETTTCDKCGTFTDAEEKCPNCGEPLIYIFKQFEVNE